ncbi:fimbria assembly protein [Kosakonia cowanii]|uniref:fimbria assembly protein n=1 Tax=Kosakonia cowanii TaxID=208223 RepID=UPI0023F6F1DA|nr:fimbria assembly protein [Kosakonia cowanii]MDF7758752.1 fimbria assembly protein [Kosakonia cowanii]
MPRFLCFILLLGCAASAADAQTNIELRGTVIHAGCAVESSDRHKTVSLGRWPVRQLQMAGNITTPVAFSLRLKGCPPGSVSITFSGKAASNSGWLALSDNKMAHQVAIQLRDHDLSPLELETPSQVMLVDGNGNSLLQFFANYIALVNNPTAGIAKADATFTINYY